MATSFNLYRHVLRSVEAVITSSGLNIGFIAAQGAD
jgi:hypothetical protein